MYPSAYFPVQLLLILSQQTNTLRRIQTIFNQNIKSEFYLRIYDVHRVPVV